MKNRQRYGYKQHWSKEYRRLQWFRKLNAILREGWRGSVADAVFSESPIMIYMERRGGRR